MNKRQIIQLIKKMAQLDVDLDPAPTAAVAPAVSAPAARSGYAGGKDPGIVKMQQALINVAKLITDQFQQKPANAVVGSVSFSDFIAQNYLKKTPVSAAATEYEAIDPHKMINIMETVTGIGSQKYDFVVDGKWGPKTNKSLNNIKSFASAMLKLAEDFKIQLESYSIANLAQFTVPAKDTEWTQQQKQEYAPILTEHIDLIAKMFDEIKDKLLNNSKHKEYIEGTKPLISYEAPLSSSEIKHTEDWAQTRFSENDITFGIPQPGAPDHIIGGKINFQDLLSKDNFNKWMKSDDAKDLRKLGVTKYTIIAGIKKALQNIKETSEKYLKPDQKGFAVETNPETADRGR